MNIKKDIHIKGDLKVISNISYQYLIMTIYLTSNVSTT